MLGAGPAAAALRAPPGSLSSGITMAGRLANYSHELSQPPAARSGHRPARHGALPSPRCPSKAGRAETTRWAAGEAGRLIPDSCSPAATAGQLGGRAAVGS